MVEILLKYLILVQHIDIHLYNMKKKTNKKKVPAYAFGINEGLDIASILGSGLQGFAEEGSGLDIAGSTLGGAAKGASIGMAAGPIGGIVGGAVGGVGNLVTSLFKKGAINKQKRIKANAKEVAMGKGNAATYQQNYWDDNTLAYTFENGGILSDLAYVDNNEIIRDDFGNIEQVPNSKPGTDNHLIDASSLDSVLSDKIKRPGTNRTFAQEGKKLVNMTKKSKGKDRFAQNSDKLNQINANAMYEQLLAEQEAIKAKKGIKPKVKGIPAYEDGKRSRSLGREIPLLSREAFGIYANAIKNFFTEPAANTNIDGAINEAFNPNSLNQRGGLGSRKYWNTTNSNMTAAPYGESALQPVTITGGTIPVGVSEPMFELPEVALPDAAPLSKPSSKGVVTKGTTKGLNNAKKPDDAFIKAPVPELLNAPSLAIAPKKPVAEKIGAGLPKAPNNKSNNKSSFDFSSLSGLSPILYNWIQSRRKPEVENQVLNPYTGAINRAMASRRANIEPTLAANRRSRAIARNNMARLNPNTGMNLAYGNQLAASEYAQNAATYANRDNMNNQYLGEYANVMNNLGQQYVQNTVLTNDLNARNRAAARNFGSTAAGQLGQWSQTKEQMRNQARRDRQILPFLADFLKEGYTQDKVNNLYNRTTNKK